MEPLINERSLFISDLSHIAYGHRLGDNNLLMNDLRLINDIIDTFQYDAFWCRAETSLCGRLRMATGTSNLHDCLYVGKDIRCADGIIYRRMFHRLRCYGSRGTHDKNRCDN